MSSSSDAGSLPPRRRRRHIASSSEEEVLPGRPGQAPESQENGPRGGGAIPKLQQKMPSDPVASQRGSPAPARDRRGARSSRVLGSRVSTREEVTFYIDNDLLIQLVEARPALWDLTDRRHADHSATRLLWHEICEAIVPNWEDLRERQRDQCRAQIMVRWRSIRDRYKKDYNEELRAPSGSVGTSRREYRYHAAMGFLRRTLELRRTTGSTRVPEVLQEELPDKPATAGSSGLGQTTGRDTEVPLTEPPSDPTMAKLAPVLQPIIRRQRAGRSRHADYEDLTRLVFESLMGSSNRVATLEARLVRLQERAVSSQKMSPVQSFLNSLVPVMEQFTPDQLFEARRLVDCALWQVQRLPPSFPPSQPYTQSQPFSQCQSFPPSHSHPPSLSQTPEQLSHPFSPSPPHYFPPTSFTTPSSLAREPPPPSLSSTIHTPSVARAPTGPFLSNRTRGVLYLL